MSIKWSDYETEVIEFFASYNALDSVHKYTASHIACIWDGYYPNFPERSSSSISHKLREVVPYDLKADFIKYLEETNRTVLSINDIATYYNIPKTVAESLIDLLEEQLNISFYNWESSSMIVSTALSVLKPEAKIIHAKEFFEETLPPKQESEPKPDLEPDNTEEVDDIPFSKQAVILGDDNKEEIISTESKEYIIEKIKEIQFELNNPFTTRNRKKTLKKNLKKYKKKFGSEIETLYDKELRLEEERNRFIENTPKIDMGNTIKEEKESKLDPANLIKFKLGVISDTHIGTRWFDEKALRNFYSACYKAGVERVIHAGDLFDGNNTYSYQEKDQNLVGYTAQLNWIIKNYPKYEGIVTYVVSGNHDVSIMKKQDIHPIQELAKTRYDIKFSGNYYSDFNKDGVKIRVIHCDGANYTGEPMTKMKGLIDASIRKPHIFIMGHLHQAMELHDYGGVQYAVAPGCFVKENEYTIRRAYIPAVGGFILDITYNPITDKINVESRWITLDE